MKESTRIIRFMIIGTLNALITALVIVGMMKGLGFDHVIANIVGYIAALINNFFWSKYWIFSSKKGKFRREVPLFLIAFGAAYGAQFLTLLGMVEILNWNEYISQFIGLFIYGTVNFLMNRKVTFRKKEKHNCDQ
ncbi:MAG: GtrA family protein [Tannerellaceae bacterium]|nr:GtrA family protein [Tannerellaceae bacterium]